MRCMSVHKPWRTVFGLLVVFVSFPTALQANAAAPAVIATGTHATHLIRDYLITHPVNRNRIATRQQQIINQVERPALSQQVLSQHIMASVPKTARLPLRYPVRSRLLHPGTVVKRHINMALPQPLFIVGNDPLSKHWLTRYQKRLHALHAIGVVVNVKSRVAMQSLQAQFPPLPLIAISGDVLASTLTLTHYPVLISSHVIQQ